MIYSTDDLMRAMKEAFLCGSQASLNDSKADPLKLADDYIADQRKRISPTVAGSQASSVGNNNMTPLPIEVKPEGGGGIK